MLGVIGVDPGIDGGLALLAGDSGLDTAVMPVASEGKHRAVDEQAVVAWFRGAQEVSSGVHCWIEKVHSMPKQGIAGSFTFGLGYGLVRGICAALGIPYELITPQRWQKVMLAGQPKGSEYHVASRLWPNHDWIPEGKRTPHSGCVDAALIAEAGRRILVGG